MKSISIKRTAKLGHVHGQEDTALSDSQVFLIMIYRFNRTPVRIPTNYFGGINKLILTYI